MLIDFRMAVCSNTFDASWERALDERMVLREEMLVRWVWISRAWMVLEREMIWGSMEGKVAKVVSWF